MIQERPLPTSALPPRPLCPRCNGSRLLISTTLEASYEIALDPAGELSVLDEHLGDGSWETDNRVRCPSCVWEGTLVEILSPAGS